MKIPTPFLKIPVGFHNDRFMVHTSRDENGAESFRLFRGKTETEWKYGNGNGILQNGNRNGNFYAETETETEQQIPAE